MMTRTKAARGDGAKGPMGREGPLASCPVGEGGRGASALG